MARETLLEQPFLLKIDHFVLSNTKKLDNEQIHLGFGPRDLSLIRVRKLKDRVIVEDSENKEYIVLTKNSKKVSTEDTLISDSKNLNEVYEKIINKSINLKWKVIKGETTSFVAVKKDAYLDVIKTLEDRVHLKQQEVSDDGVILKAGLRPPQVGAIYSILSDLAISNDPVSVVLPTGTGKTESILGTIVANKIAKSLIIVPSDGLRNQFFSNCQKWGILRDVGVVGNEALNPIVCKIGSSLKDETSLLEMIVSSNIIIATSSILNRLSPKALAVLNANVSTVFIDEAHHSAAPSWERLKSDLSNLKIIQFTATPFREDGKHISGKIIFNYPLEEAQKNNFFTKIEFVPVVDYDPDNWHKTISEKAIEILEKDIKDGHNHILMARVDNIAMAKEIFNKYYKKHTKYNPILITSKTVASNLLIEKLRKGESQIVVCVNMLGEGIDIPQLKIAALHDIRKSLTITLQFIGRFTRSNKSTSPAKIIANIADVKIERRLRQLYKEDADWGKLIAFSSAKEIQKKIKFQEVLANFKNSKIPLFNLKPKLSAVVYQTKDDKWNPESIEKYLSKNQDLFLCDINEQDGIAIAIHQIEEGIDWMDSKVFVENSWELLLFYFDKSKKILYVNSSQKNVDQSLVDQIVNVDFKFERESPFKCYYGLGNVVLFTLGLDKNTDNPIKYAMYAGSDIFDAIGEMEKNKSSKSNTYGYGFKDGEEITIGASKHGKIWSRLIGNVQDWKDWCDEIGAKLLDPTIDVATIFKGFLQPKRFTLAEFSKLPDPTSIDFPTAFYQEKESSQWIVIDNRDFELSEITTLISKNATGFNIDLIYNEGIYNMHLIYNDDDTFTFTPQNFKKIEYKKNSKIIDFLPYLANEDTFRIRLLDGTFIENNYHFKPHNQESVFPIDLSFLNTIDWTGVTISNESMGLVKPYLADSIQNKIYEIKKSSGLFDVIVNDDNAGEAADLLCFGIENDYLRIEVIHCKYNLKTNPLGSRTKDFYELCCQAQKTVKNFTNILRLFDHIKTRAVKTEKNGGTRFLKGDLKTLELLLKSNSYRRPKIKVILVQPGLLKTKANKEVLELIGSTYSLLKETLNADFEVICS